MNDISSSYSPFNFNISHQGNYAVLAAETDRQVGIDVMKTSLPGNTQQWLTTSFNKAHLCHVIMQELATPFFQMGSVCFSH